MAVAIPAPSAVWPSVAPVGRAPAQTTYRFDQLEHYLDVLRGQLRIAVIYSGSKQDDSAVIYQNVNPRTWKSYEAVAEDIQQALRELGFRHVAVMPEDMNLPHRLQAFGAHLAWLNTGGVQGFHSMSHAPGMLEMLGIPYVGHSPLDASILDSKHTFKFQLQAQGVRTAPFVTWHRSMGRLRPDADRHFQAAFGGYKGPFVVKPVSGRASVLVSLVDSIDDLPDAVEQVYAQTNNHVMVEQFLAGREYCVAVAGPVSSTRGRLSLSATAVAFSMLERVLAVNEPIFTSMDKRPISEERARAVGSDEWQLRRGLAELAHQVYSALDLQSLVRLDVRADAEGTLHVLEANPKPDLKRPGEGVSSLIMLGLGNDAESYRDLIYGLLADRLHYLFSYRREAIAHIVNLIPTPFGTRSRFTHLSMSGA